MPKIDWNKIEKSNALILKNNEPVRIKFLDNGNVDNNFKLTDKQTEKEKTVDKYYWSVIDLSDNQEKEFSTLAMTLMTKFKEFQPLKDKSLTINKFKTGFSDFDVDYKVVLIE